MTSLCITGANPTMCRFSRAGLQPGQHPICSPRTDAPATRAPLPVERDALTEAVKARATADGLAKVLAGHIRSAEARREATIYCEDARLREEIGAGELIPRLQMAGLLATRGQKQMYAGHTFALPHSGAARRGRWRSKRQPTPSVEV